MVNPQYKHPKIGRCIYCGTAEGRLSDEHIVPQGLGGPFILREASCASCAKVTGEVEQVCLQTMIGPIRYEMGLSRRKKRTEQTTIPLRVVGQDDVVTIRLVTIQEHSGFFALPILGPPHILTGQLPTAPENVIGVWRSKRSGGGNPIAEALGGKDTEASFHPYLLSRMLAKISHAFLVFKLGASQFEPVLIDLIQGRFDDATQFVGGDLLGTKLQPEMLHILDFTREGPWFVVSIQLFAHMGAPVYRIVAGRVIDAKEN